MRLISNNKGSDISALDFVVDAFEDFRAYMKTKKYRKLVDDPIIKKDWHVVQGWEDIDVFYGNRMGEIYTAFAKQYLGLSTKDRQLKNFDDFLSIFLNDFYKNTNFPLTKSGFMNSRRVGPHFSGLCLKISNADVTGYSNKYNNFVNSKNFEIFSLAAAQFGFMLDYNVPWRLIANLNSPKLKPYIEDRANIVKLISDTNKTFGATPEHSHEYEIDGNRNGYTGGPKSSSIAYHVHEIIQGEVMQAQYYSDIIPNTSHIHDVSYDNNYELTMSDIYGIYFYKTSSVDIETLKIYLIDMYNTYVENYLITLYKEQCPQAIGYVGFDNIPNTVTKQIIREKVDIDTVNNEYKEIFWYKLYFNIRLKEFNSPVSDEKVAHALRKMEEYYFAVDNERALRYINDYIRQFY